MRKRPSSRLLIVDRSERVLLFRFVHNKGPLAGQDFWSTPGGGVEGDETFAEAAVRELREETGLVVHAIGIPVAARTFVMQLPDGEFVEADERYFVVRSNAEIPSTDGWTVEETDVIADHRWWTIDGLTYTTDVVWPENLLEMLAIISR